MSKSALVLLLMLSCGVFFSSCNSTVPAVEPEPVTETEIDPQGIEEYTGYLTPTLLDGTNLNPIITHIYTADPTARVFNDRIYLYASHDEDDQKGYDMKDYHIFSSDDLVNWQDHGVALKAEDMKWVSKLYAPDCVYDEASGKYFLYFPNNASNIGVAVSDRPQGPFTDALGKPLIDKAYPGANVPWCFDPGILVDDDGQTYLYFGGGMPDTGDNVRVIRLNEDMISLKDNEAAPIVAPDFFEASFPFKREGRYYFSYSTNWNGHGIRIDYMMSDNPMTGFEYKGTVIDNPPKNQGNNNHHSLVEFKGNWYVFYHDRKMALSENNHSGYQRSVSFDKIDFAENGEILRANLTGGTVEQLKAVDPFVQMEAESFAAQYGIEIENFSDPAMDHGVYLRDIQNGDWIGISRVDFKEGAAEFRGRIASSEENGTIEIWIDGGQDNGGQKIGQCKIPDTGGLDNWVDINCTLENVQGEHNLYLIFKGATQPQELFRIDYYLFQ